MRSEAFTFPILPTHAAVLPGGRWVDPMVLDDAIGAIAVAVAELMAASSRQRVDVAPGDAEAASIAVRAARDTLGRLIDDAITLRRPA